MTHFDPLWVDRTNQIAYGVMAYGDHVILTGYIGMGCTSYIYHERIDLTEEQLLEIGHVHTPYATPEQEKTIRRITYEAGRGPKRERPKGPAGGGDLCARCGEAAALEGEELCAFCREEIGALADRVFGTVNRERAARNKEPWYMLNIAHPVIEPLYARWRLRHKIPMHYPPSDHERMMFELDLLNSGTLAELEKVCGEIEREKAQQKTV